MAEKKSEEFDPEATSGGMARLPDGNGGIISEDGQVPVEELNATQMGIDIASLNLDATSANIRVAPPSDAEIIQKKIEEKKSSFSRIFSAIFSGSGAGAKKKRRGQELSPSLLRWLHIWVCDPDFSGGRKFLFYLHRLTLLVFGCYLQFLIFKHVQSARESDHPAFTFKLIVALANIMSALIFVVLRASPAWFVALPLSAISLILGYGAYAFHARDMAYFSFAGHSLADLLNAYYLVVLVPAALAAVFIIARASFWRFVYLLLYVCLLVPLLINSFKGISLETSLFGYDFLPDLPQMLQPVFIILHGGIPLLALIHLGNSFGRSQEGPDIIARGFSLALAFLLLCTTPLGFAIMQENRVFSAVNLVLPLRLNIGGVELETLNQMLKIETVNFGKNQGSDDLPRYRFLLEPSRETGSFVLQSVDEFGLPVRNLVEEDLTVTADGQRIRSFELREYRRAEALKKFLKVPDRMPNIRNVGVYVLKLKLEEKQQLLQWSEVKDVKNADESITFEIGDIRKVHSVRFKVKNETLLDIPELKESSIIFPLSYFAPGEHTLAVSLYDEGGVEVLTKELTFKIAAAQSFTIISPIEGDLVAQALPVVLLSRQDFAQESAPLVYQIDGQVVAETKTFEPVRRLDVTGLAEGPHTLTVQLKSKSGNLEKKVAFNTAAQAPLIDMDSPAMGSFVGRDTHVHFKLPSSESVIAGLRVFVNGDPFEDFTLADNGFDLPASRWSHAELYVAVQATLKSGERVGDWVLLNKGQGSLGLTFDNASLGFLNFKRITFVLDASVSMYDNWMGSSKWLALKNLVTQADIERIIEKMDPGVVVFGNRKPQYLGDCQDAEFAVKNGRYDKTEIGKLLSSMKPTGVAALVRGLDLALDAKPDRIFVFTDGSDSCKPSLQKALAKSLQKSPTTSLDVFALGMLDEKAKVSLQSLAQASGGVFYQPQNPQFLQKALLERLTVVFQVLAGDKIIYQGPLENRNFDLVPGTYSLKLSAGGDLIDVGTFAVSNGLSTRAVISGDAKANKIKVDEKVTNTN